MTSALRLASFTIAATVEQGAAWKRAAELAGHLSIGTWFAEAADCHAAAHQRPGASILPPPLPPIALSWRRGGRFRVVLEEGREEERAGMISQPFGIFKEEAAGPTSTAYTLAYLPERRILGTFRYSEQARALAAGLASTLLHGLPPPDPGGVGAIAS